MTEEVKWLQLSINGDTAAFEKIVTRYQAMVCAITFSGTGRVDISEDLAQETFLSAWKNLAQLKNMDGFRAWLCAIARNALHNHYRQKKTVSLDQSDPDALCSGTDTPSETLIHQEELAMLEQAMMRIPVEYREPLVMFYRQHQSTRQVAESLGLNESTVRTRLHRARQMLREEIAARLERTLEQTAPGKTFTKTVMAAVASGLAASAAGTASAAAVTTAAAGTGASAATGLAAVMSTVTAKIITAAAIAAITIGGVFAYRHLLTAGSAACPVPCHGR
jgi:RNA polymerase sigma factor (sigma-70 family)